MTISPYDSDNDDEFIVQHNPYIEQLAQRNVPHELFHADTLALEKDELAQTTRIKLWSKVRKKELIENPKAYIRSIANTASVDMVRKHKSTQTLPVGEDGELYQGNMIATPSEGMRDPAFEFELREMTPERMNMFVDAIIDLSSAQQKAVICTIKDHKDDVSQLLLAELSERGICVEALSWPKDKKVLASLKMSLSHARKKLLFLKEHREEAVLLR